VEGVISSCPTLATNDKHSLTPLGLDQATNSSKVLLDLITKEETKPHRVFFYTSPFARARQTAQACLKGFKYMSTEDCVVHDDVIIHYGLMERCVRISLYCRQRNFKILHFN
jgi:broad specificity phosphatase PhoE